MLYPNLTVPQQQSLDVFKGWRATYNDISEFAGENMTVRRLGG